jgi:microcystin degradation protein MlrC
MSRIGVAMLYHETNTFADASTGTTRYDRFDVWRGNELLDKWGGSKTAPIGMHETIQAIGAEAVPLYGAFAQPSGTIESRAYARLREELLTSLRDNHPLDAVALALHGAAVAESVDDVEADIALAVRDIVGPNVPVVGSFDLHGNIRQEMAEAMDGFFGFRLYPHEDMYESGEEAVRLIASLLDAEVRPVTHVEYIPVLLPPSTTDHYPAAEVNRLCEEVEGRPGIIDCTFFHGFPYADIPQVGASVVAISDDNRDLARSVAHEIATWIWDHREDFRATDPSATEAIERAVAAPGKPVVINESSDNCGGGSPGDGTHLLKAMIDARVGNSCFASIYDPEVAAQAHDAGEGTTIEVDLGGKHDDLHGKAIAASAYVESLTNGRFTLKSFAPGMKMDLGPSARLRIDDIDVVVVSGQSQVFDPEIFLLHGIDVTRCDIVALKSSAHFRAGFRDIAKEIITADTPGVTTSHVEVFDRRNNKVSLWPVDQDSVYGKKA